MKRDMDLIRALLMDLEEPGSVDLSSYTEAMQVYHASLLVDAKLVEGNVARDGANQPFAVNMTSLTWAGHDFLDAARSDSVWEKAKAKVVKAGGSMTFDLLKMAMVGIIRDQMSG